MCRRPRSGMVDAIINVRLVEGDTMMSSLNAHSAPPFNLVFVLIHRLG